MPAGEPAPIPVLSPLVIYVDASSPNNGSRGQNLAGCVIYRDGEELEAHRQMPVPGTTNNEGEYHAILFGLGRAAVLGATTFSLYSDSQLCVNQINGKWACNVPHLLRLRDEARERLARFASVEIAWKPREENRRADALAAPPTAGGLRR